MQALFLNLDETQFSYTFHKSQGIYVKRLKRAGHAHARVRKRDLRGAVTPMAIICERPESSRSYHK